MNKLFDLIAPNQRWVYILGSRLIDSKPRLLFQEKSWLGWNTIASFDVESLEDADEVKASFKNKESNGFKTSSLITGGRHRGKH